MLKNQVNSLSIKKDQFLAKRMKDVNSHSVVHPNTDMPDGQNFRNEPSLAYLKINLTDEEPAEEFTDSNESLDTSPRVHVINILNNSPDRFHI